MFKSKNTYKINLEVLSEIIKKDVVIMGFRVRKSINLGGGFRVNISKSGVGYSWGTKGFRVTKTAKGTTRTTTSIPGTGISYVSESKKHPSVSQTSSESSQNKLEENESIIETDSLYASYSADYKDFVSNLQKLKDVNRFLNWAILLSVFIAPYFEWALWILLIVKIWFRFFKKIHLNYEFEDPESAYNEMKPFELLSSSREVWRISQGSVTPSLENDISTTTSAEIEPIDKFAFMPFYLRTNIQPVTFQYKKEKFLFFPEKVLIENKQDITAIAYKDLNIKFEHLNFIFKGGKVPLDTRVIGSQYTYVNKDGSPDRRHKDNPQFPICSFVGVSLSNKDINMYLISSNSNLISEINEFKSSTTENQ